MARENVEMLRRADAKALLLRGLASVDIVDGVPDEYLDGIGEGIGR